MPSKSVSLSRSIYFDVGSRTDRRDTFRYENHPWFSPFRPAYRLFKFAPSEFVLALGNCSCIALPPASMQSKEKYPKEKTPGFRQYPALLAFGKGFRKGYP